MMPTRKHIFPVVMVAVVLSVLGAAPRAAERVALVIGNAAYEHTTALRNPRNDAADMARVLEGLGFEVIKGLDLDERAFEGKLREFAKAARGAAVTVFFYAGHGLQVEGENYLVPTDAKLAEEVDLRLEAFELAAFLRQMRGDTNLVFLDACHDNPLARSLARSMGPTRSSAIGRGLGRVETASGTLIAYATQPGNVADDGEGRNSPFTAALLAHITTPGLSVNDLLTSVTDEVVTGTAGRQQPWTNSSLRKPFYFQPAPSQGAQEAYAAAERLGTIAAFQVVVDRFPGSAQAEQARTRIAVLEAGKTSTEVELLFWESVKDSEHAADIEAYLDRYPGGAYEVLARNRLRRLEDSAKGTEPPEPARAAVPGHDTSPASARVEAEAKFWALVEESDVASDLEAYLEHYPGGVYAPLARLRLAQLKRERSAPQAALSPMDVTTSEDSPDVAASVSLPVPEELESSLGLERAERRRVQAGVSAPDSPGSNRVTAERELLFWESVKDSRDPSDIRLYLERYSGGTYEALAHNRLKRLVGLAKSTGLSVSTPKAPSKSAQEGEMRLTVEREFWALVKESEEPSDLEAYLEHYPDGVYAPLARLRLAQLKRGRSAPQAASSLPDVATSEDSPDALAPPAASVAVSTPEELESSLGLERAERRRIQAGLASLG